MNTNAEEFIKDNTPKKLYSSDSLYSLELVMQKDSLTGKHCFTAFEGRKIDCSVDDKSLFLKKDSINVFTGTMQSYLDENIYKVKMRFYKDSVLLLILDNQHEFLADRTVFFTSKKH